MKAHTQARVFAVLALVAVGIYFLSCKPAWSPDGDKLAYICTREVGGEERYAVATYNLTTKKSRIVVEEDAHADGPRIVPIEVFWPRRGDELVYVSAPEDEDAEDVIRISTFDLRTKTVVAMKELAVPDVDSRSSLFPLFLHRKRWLWIQGDDTCWRVDLKRETVSPMQHTESIFFENGRKVFFATEGPDGGIVLGKVKTLFGLKEAPLFTVRAEGDAEVLPVIAVPSKRTRFACIVGSENAKTLKILDKTGRSLEEIALPASIDLDDGILGAQWSPDGAFLWVTVGGTNDADVQYAGIAEIDVARGSVRIIKVNEDGQYGGLAPLHPSLSPAGDYLACSLYGDGGVGLCLVDLTDDERPVKIVWPPIPPAETE